MRMRKQSMPVFGVRNGSLPQKTRSCAYAVIVGPDGRIAAVQEEQGRVYLPGGGVEPLETPGQAVHREVMEEIGHRVQLIAVIGQSLHYMEADGHCQATHARFYSAELGEKITTACEHELRWVAIDEFYHPSQSWAAQHCMVLQAGNMVEQA